MDIIDNVMEEYDELRERYTRLEEIASEIIEQAAGDEKTA